MIRNLGTLRGALVPSQPVCVALSACENRAARSAAQAVAEDLTRTGRRPRLPISPGKSADVNRPTRQWSAGPSEQISVSTRFAEPVIKIMLRGSTASGLDGSKEDQT